MTLVLRDRVGTLDASAAAYGASGTKAADGHALTIAGSLGVVNSTLTTATYHAGAGTGPDTITSTVSDGLASATGADFLVQATNVGPSLTVSSTPLSLVHNTTTSLNAD